LEKAAVTGKLTYILNQSDQKQLPASVALLPVVESAYQDNAISPKGAAGLWQLMPETARENGISPENRTDFIPSTQAALNYLKQLHEQFGNWTLAFAAYNAGQERVMQALQKNPAATSLEELDLPKETKNYINALISIDQKLTQQG
jgi:membrane-bound lytic murein transglycosylase D